MGRMSEMFWGLYAGGWSMAIIEGVTRLRMMVQMLGLSRQCSDSIAQEI